MFTSVIRRMIPYFIVSAFCLVFSLVYEQFSHGITSVFMFYAFIIPLVAGLIISLLGKFINKTLYRASWVALLLYFYMRGVIEIFGTTSVLLPIYLYVSVIMLVLSLIIKDKKKSRI